MTDHDAIHTAGSIRYLNPITRFLRVGVHHATGHAHNQQEGGRQEKQQQPRTGIHYHVYRSRDNRKGRHALALTPSVAAHDGSDFVTKTPRPRNSLSATLAGVVRMVTKYPVWDVSYDVAVVFTLGSIIRVISGFFVLIPLINPASSWSSESSWGGGISAFVGAIIFEVGSVLLMLEAVNENRADCFGWALEEALEGSRGNLLQLRREASAECKHHHVEKTALLSSRDERSRRHDRKWTWCPPWKELRTHYFRDIGFLACFSQMTGATVFWISGLTGLPQILDVLAMPVENGIYWLPQVVGGTGFIISSWLFMLETQSKWYLPAPKQLGWHIGFWNLVGALGFTLCGALGFASNNNFACEIGLTWATFIGSWAFLIGSIIQWYESLDKYPYTIDENVLSRETQSNKSPAGSVYK